MNHFEKIAVQLESYGLDAILLTGEANRFYATGFHSMGTDGAALITRKKNYYFTDARYTEAAGRCIQNAQLRETGHGHGYADLLAEVVSSDHIGRMGFEDACMTVQEHARYQKALSCELVPATELLWKLRAQKDLEELEALTSLKTFNAAKTVVTINGFSIHPGTSKDKMRNALLIAMEYNALLPAVLHRGTMRCPDMEQLAAAMDRLYGAQISPTIRKRGETQCLGFVASFIDDRFVSRNEPLLEPAAELLRESASVRTTECRLIGGKIILKGVVCVEVLYLSESGTICSAAAELPFSQIVEGVEDADENTSAEAMLCLTGAELRIGGGELLAIGFSGRAVGRAKQRLLDEVASEKLANEHGALVRRAERLYRSGWRGETDGRE